LIAGARDRPEHSRIFIDLLVKLHPQTQGSAALLDSRTDGMVAMTTKDAPTSPGAPDQLRQMTRLYLAAKLAPSRRAAQQRAD
jgi:hypothetical protein